MKTLQDKLNRYFGKENQAILGNMLRWGFEDEELTKAEELQLIEITEEGIVYKNEY